MKTTEDIFRINAEYYSNLFQLVAKCGIIDFNTFEIDSQNLDSIYISTDVRAAKDFQEMFEWLKQYDAFPCLYRWEIVSPAILYPNMVETIKMRIKEISKHSSIQTPRIVKSSYPKDNTLYVGKSENIVDRIMKHLGYHQQRDKHGLHLYDLVKEIDYHIIFNLHIYIFPQECKPIMELFERSLAEVHPTLVGTHN